jgi:hypothetical protein
MVRYVPLWYVLTNLLNIDYLSKIVEKESQVKSRTNINKKEIIKTWLTGQKSCTLIIPKEIAQEARPAKGGRLNEISRFI